MPLLIIRFINITLTGLLAGTSFGIWVGFNPMYFSYLTYLEQQQNTIRSLNTLMIGLVISATIITVISAYLQRKNKPALILLLLASLFLISCIVISKAFNQPINIEIMSWKYDSLPSDWTILRDKWWSYHIIRTIAELLAFALIVFNSVARKMNSNVMDLNLASNI